MQMERRASAEKPVLRSGIIEPTSVHLTAWKLTDLDLHDENIPHAQFFMFGYRLLEP